MTSTLSPTTATTAPQPPRRRWLRRLRNTGIGVAAVTVFAAGVGAATQAYAEHRDADRYPAPGQLVEIDGHTLHLNITGTKHAGEGPTVILESGMGPAFSDAWAWYQNAIDDYAQVVSYDRPGLGWSDPHPHGTDPVQLAEDLHAALDQADVEGPYLVVGHSLGAFHSRVFTQIFHDDVAGLVLLDPSHEDQWERFPKPVLDAQPTYNRLLQTLPVAARFGITRLYHPLEMLAEDLPAPVQDRARAQVNKVDHLAATWDERDAFDEIGDAARDHGSELGDIPLLVLSAGIEPEMPEITQTRVQMGKEFAEFSADGAWDLIANADHNGLVSNGDLAAQVTPRIADMWQDVR